MVEILLSVTKVTILYPFAGGLWREIDRNGHQKDSSSVDLKKSHNEWSRFKQKYILVFKGFLNYGHLFSQIGFQSLNYSASHQGWMSQTGGVKLTISLGLAAVA